MGKLSDAEILTKVLEALGLTANAISVKLKYKSPATIYHILNGVNNISDGFIVRVINEFPNINYSFMKTGEGDILLDEESKKNQANLFNINIEENKQFSPGLEWMNIPEKLDRLIELQVENNELLKEFIVLTKKKGI